MKYVVAYWPYFALSIFGFLLFTTAQIALADLMQFIVDTISGTKDTANGILSSLFKAEGDAVTDVSTARVQIVVTIILVGIFRGIGYFLGTYNINYVSGYLVHNLRCDIFKQLLRVPTSVYNDHPSGYLISKIVYNVSQVTGAATNAIQVLIREGLLAVGLLCYLFYINWKLSLLFLIALPFIALIVKWVSRRFRKISHRIQDSVGGVSDVTSEAVNGHKEIRIFGGSDYERERFDQASELHRSQSMKMAFYKAASSPVIQLPILFVLAALIWFALGLATEMSAGQFVAYLTAAMLLPKPIRQLSNINSVIQKGLAACDDIFHFIDLPPEVDTGTHKVGKVRGALEFRDVSFQYPNKEQKILNHINLSVDPGQTVALVGLSGSGKSSLVSMLSRFYDYDSGKIFIDGVDIKDYPLKELRSQLSLVTQHVTLFNDSIFNNIAYGAMSGASREQVIAAAEAAHAMEFIEKMPEGLETQVGENATLLSGGQKQRIAIARALLKDSPILILDEATSALDNKAEYHIQEALKTVMENRTTIVIAHRLSTIEHADKIAVMEAGQIVEQGTHQELLAQEGRYSALYSKQFSD
jgi:subfamily B ATP-binding cassette protein MsbA